jgi:predicted dinucleotide-binding enzyme
MKYAIIGSGKLGAALARTFARKNIEVGIANSRGLTVKKEHVGELTILTPNLRPASIAE